MGRQAVGRRFWIVLKPADGLPKDFSCLESADGPPVDFDHFGAGRRSAEGFLAVLGAAGRLPVDF